MPDLDQQPLCCVEKSSLRGRAAYFRRSHRRKRAVLARQTRTSA
jgi:hypothetical protein